LHIGETKNLYENLPESISYERPTRTGEDNIKIDVANRIRGYGLDSCGSVYGPGTDSCKHDNELLFEAIK
jgi:hypothetical protein